MTFPTVLDSTTLSHFRACPRKFQLESLEHWKHKTPNVHLHAGKAFAEGLEMARRAFYEKGLSVSDSEAIGFGALAEAYGSFETLEGSNKSLDRMLGALEYYFSTFPLSTDHITPHKFPAGTSGIEYSFLEPLERLHPDSREPLLYSGRFDMIADFRGGLWGYDDKTASQLGAQWIKSFDLRSQFSAYCWGARKGGIPLNGFIVRGISILKTSYGNAEAITYRPGWMIDRWEKQLYKDIDRMIAMYKEGEWDYNLDESCNGYGGCIFRPICLANNPEAWLKVSFEKRIWDPVLRIETVVE